MSNGPASRLPSSRLKTILLIAVSGLLGLALVEAGARLVLGPPPATAGVLVFSEFPFADPGADPGGDPSRGTVRYAPNRSLRTLSVYGPRREFDVRFPTNNLGFVDHRDYPLAVKDRNIAVVGDSYTAGYHGGEPWVPKLRDSLPRANVYNLGVTGAGFEHFAALLGDVSEALAVNEVVIVAISSDVTRKNWRPVGDRGRLHFCAVDTSREACLAKGSAVLILGDDKSDGSVAARIEEFYDSLPLPGVRRYLSRHTHIGRIFHSRTWKRRSKPLDPVAVPGFAVQALKTIRKQFPAAPITLVQVPEKREVLAAAYSADLAAAAKAAGIGYLDGLRVCGLVEDDYFSQDPHPNAGGYGKIHRCIAEVLKRR